MKLKNLKSDYLEGVIDGLLANYNAHCKSLPEGFGYKIETGIVGGENKFVAKIILWWTIEEPKLISAGDYDNEPKYSEGKSREEGFYLYGGEEITEVQNQIECILDVV